LRAYGASAAWFDKMIDFARFNAFIGLGEMRALEAR